MPKVFRGSCTTLIPHPSLQQFNERTLLETFFNPMGKERGGALDKWYYFYCNPVRDPVVITVQHNAVHLHPGLKRFIGTALREQQQLPAWIVCDQPFGFPEIYIHDQVHEGNDWMDWIIVQKTCEFTNQHINDWIRTHVKFRWELEVAPDQVYVMNPYAQEVKQRYKVSDLGLVGAIKELFRDCGEFTTPPALAGCGANTT